MSIYQTSNEIYSEFLYMFSFGIATVDTFSNFIEIVKPNEQKENNEIYNLLIDYISGVYSSGYRDNLLEICGDNSQIISEFDKKFIPKWNPTELLKYLNSD